MSDPFDAFAAFDPFDGLGPDPDDRDRPGEDAQPRPPSAEPTEESLDRARGTTRRWSAIRRSLGVSERAGERAAGEPRRANTADAQPAGSPETPHAAPPASAADTQPHPDLGPVRAIALLELRAAVTRLRAHRHDVEIINELDSESEPCLGMRFRPDTGPLGPALTGPVSYARFELRLAGPREASPFDGIQLFAGFVPVGAETRFILLGRTPVHALTPDWVAQRIVDFVARALEP